MRVHTVPITLAGSFPVIVLAQPIGLVRVWNPLRIDTNRVGCHLNMGALGEDSVVMQRQGLAHNGVKANY
jgi:hypothetical protein